MARIYPPSPISNCHKALDEFAKDINVTTKTKTPEFEGIKTQRVDEILDDFGWDVTTGIRPRNTTPHIHYTQKDKAKAQMIELVKSVKPDPVVNHISDGPRMIDMAAGRNSGISEYEQALIKAIEGGQETKAASSSPTKCGSHTVVNGVCSICGCTPNLDKRFFSKEEWLEMERHGMIEDPNV